MRIDKFLWCIRLYKTRSLAAKQCELRNVKINDEIIAKSSKTISIGDSISIKVAPIWKSYKIKDIPKSRVGAKLLPELIIETTSEEDLKLLASIQRENRALRLQGKLGRPTKKDRRDLDWFTDQQ